jgi:hypothetical protein
MAIKQFLPIAVLGPGDETIKVNIDSIIDIRPINVGAKAGQAQNWYVQVNMLAGKYYLLRTEGAPYATKEEAMLVRDQLLEELN